MTERLSRQYKLKKLEIKLAGGDSKDIRDLVADFQYHEAIESPFIRCDYTILDAVDFNKALQGGEEISVELETDSSKGQPLKFTNKVWKIGSIIKSERGQMYILHTVSSEMFNNELNKVFDAFGPESKKDKDNIPKYICEKYHKGQNKVKSENFEGFEYLQLDLKDDPGFDIIIAIYSAIDFLENAPPTAVYENEYFPIGLSMSNEGAADISNGYLAISLDKDYMWVDRASLDTTESKLRFRDENHISFDMDGKSIENPFGFVGACIVSPTSVT